MGIGHDILQDLRTATGLHSYIMRRQKHSRGQAQMEKVSKCQDRASRKKQALVQNYISNWQKISRILRISNISHQRDILLKGLQPLSKDEDIRFFEEWGNQPTNYMEHSQVNLSWIWRVAMEGQPDKVPIQSSEIKNLTDSWESEGKCFK